jgi:hypothetical protein
MQESIDKLMVLAKRLESSTQVKQNTLQEQG